MKQIMGIYQDEDDWAISDGKALYFLYDDIHAIDADVEVGECSYMEHIPDLHLSVSLSKKRWSIKKIDGKEVASGTYIDKFADTVERFKRRLVGC
ncbi:MAG: hypothetical protein H8D23_21645 [Candidatus Brocadiales bacterium]|nr:hypothetical protein [Candidatus Brocadiales bacterium]